MAQVKETNDEGLRAEPVAAVIVNTKFQSGFRQRRVAPLSSRSHRQFERLSSDRVSKALLRQPYDFVLIMHANQRMRF